MEQNQYYYFIDGYDQVFIQREYICDGDEKHRQYHELSNQQLEWYLAHPGASAHEVKQLCTDEEYRIRMLPPLEQYKSELSGSLAVLANRRIEELMSEYKLLDVFLDLQALNTGSPDTLIGGDTAQVCQDRIRYYTDIRKALKKEAARVRLQIGAAETHDEAEAAYAGHHIEEVKTGQEDWSDEQA